MKLIDRAFLFFFRWIDNVVEWAEVKGIYSRTNITFHLLLVVLVLMLPIFLILKFWLWSRGIEIPSNYPNQRILDARAYAALMKNHDKIKEEKR